MTDADDPKTLHERLDKLGKTLDEGVKSSQKTQKEELQAQISGSAMNQGMQALSGFVATVVVAGGIGWVLDQWLGSQPLLLILMIAVGSAVGLWSMYKIAAGRTRRD